MTELRNKVLQHWYKGKCSHRTLTWKLTYVQINTATNCVFNPAKKDSCRVLPRDWVKWGLTGAEVKNEALWWKNMCPSLGHACIKLNSFSTLCCRRVTEISPQTSRRSPFVSQLSFEINDYGLLVFHVQSQWTVRQRKRLGIRKIEGWESIVHDIFHSLSRLCSLISPYAISNEWLALWTALQTNLYLYLKCFPLFSPLLFYIPLYICLLVFLSLKALRYSFLSISALLI